MHILTLSSCSVITPHPRRGDEPREVIDYVGNFGVKVPRFFVMLVIFVDLWEECRISRG